MNDRSIEILENYSIVKEFLEGEQTNTKELLRSICKMLLANEKQLDDVTDGLSELEDKVEDNSTNIVEIESFITSKTSYH